MIAETVNADKETVRKILRIKWNMKKVSAKLFPKNLSPDQKLVCLQICSNSLKGLDEEELTENIITCDETRIFQSDVEIKGQFMHWKTLALPQIKKARMSKSKSKAILIIFFFYINGIVMTE